MSTWIGEIRNERRGMDEKSRRRISSCSSASGSSSYTAGGSSSDDNVFVPVSHRIAGYIRHGSPHDSGNNNEFGQYNEIRQQLYECGDNSHDNQAFSPDKVLNINRLNGRMQPLANHQQAPTRVCPYHDRIGSQSSPTMCNCSKKISRTASPHRNRRHSGKVNI